MSYVHSAAPRASQILHGGHNAFDMLWASKRSPFIYRRLWPSTTFSRSRPAERL